MSWWWALGSDSGSVVVAALFGVSALVAIVGQVRVTDWASGMIRQTAVWDTAPRPDRHPRSVARAEGASVTHRRVLAAVVAGLFG